MGAYFLVVNPVNRQYLDPGRFGEAVKFSGLLRGDYCLHALKLLVSDCFELGNASFRVAWLGNPVIFASDDSGLPNPGGWNTGTADDPGRNVHGWAKAEFTDISYRALAELCLDEELAAELAVKAVADHSLLVNLGGVMDQYAPRALGPALDRVVGRPWRKEYNKALAKMSYWQSLPPIDWPL